MRAPQQSESAPGRTSTLHLRAEANVAGHAIDGLRGYALFESLSQNFAGSAGDVLLVAQLLALLELLLLQRHLPLEFALLLAAGLHGLPARSVLRGHRHEHIVDRAPIRDFEEHADKLGEVDLQTLNRQLVLRLHVREELRQEREALGHR